MSNNAVLENIERTRIVPVVAIESAEAALPLADALLEGGLPVVEVTFRTAAAADVISMLAEKRPELLVGAGTVVTRDNLEAAQACGAKFCVSPGLNPEILEKAGEINMPFLPGVCTPSDVERGLSLGYTALKFFPAEVSGGVAMIKALAAPYGHLGVRFMPTGGVSVDNLATYLRVSSVLAVGGTWIAKQNDLAEGNWAAIRQRCQEALRIAADVTGC